MDSRLIMGLLATSAVRSYALLREIGEGGRTFYLLLAFGVALSRSARSRLPFSSVYPVFMRGFNNQKRSLNKDSLHRQFRALAERGYVKSFRVRRGLVDKVDADRVGANNYLVYYSMSSRGWNVFEKMTRAVQDNLKYYGVDQSLPTISDELIKDANSKGIGKRHDEHFEKLGFKWKD